MTNYRPYQNIEQLPEEYYKNAEKKQQDDATGLHHTIIGVVLFALVIFGLIFLWAIIAPEPPLVNDRAPALEKLERKN